MGFSTEVNKKSCLERKVSYIPFVDNHLQLTLISQNDFSEPGLSGIGAGGGRRFHYNQTVSPITDVQSHPVGKRTLKTALKPFGGWNELSPYSGTLWLSLFVSKTSKLSALLAHFVRDHAIHKGPQRMNQSYGRCR